MSRILYSSPLAACLAAAFLVTPACSDSDPIPFQMTDGDDGGGDGDGTDGGDGDLGMPGDGDGFGGYAGDGDSSMGGEASGSGGMTPVEPGLPNSVFVEKGLGYSDPWVGYLWTISSSTSSISPRTFTGEQVCVTGDVGAGYTHFAAVGWNVNQPVDADWNPEPAGTVTPESDMIGVAVDIQVNTPAGIRVQLNSNDSGGKAWCAPVPAGGKGVIPWEDFRTNCWQAPGSTGSVKYDGEEFMQILVQVVAGFPDEKTPYDYCLVDIAPAYE